MADKVKVGDQEYPVEVFDRLASEWKVWNGQVESLLHLAILHKKAVANHDLVVASYARRYGEAHVLAASWDDADRVTSSGLLNVEHWTLGPSFPAEATVTAGLLACLARVGSKRFWGGDREFAQPVVRQALAALCIDPGDGSCRLPATLVATRGKPENMDNGTRPWTLRLVGVLPGVAAHGMCLRVVEACVVNRKMAHLSEGFRVLHVETDLPPFAREALGLARAKLRQAVADGG